ncbi:beta-galactosidase [Marivita sp.]|uniref:beta-galactosidase n=1 Tax=Marivita sp. TaxID=2003365 RepID=UPI0025C35FCB|nr:beta-galactosidase [Marivita sp.]
MQRTLGTCYYPEHWPEEVWHNDAARMAELGLTWVRIGEFAWGRIEPTPGDLRWDWLDRAIEVLGQAGLKVVLGTPTATPPRWVVDKHPDMLAVDAEGRPRKFGSRRHYCFSHTGYLDECRRIVTLMAERYGRNPHVEAWQTDNEYGCHDTILSYSEAARQAFRDWLAQRYQSPEALNRAWGNVFWSMDYATFDEVDLPNLTVTEPNPSHALDFRRFSSDQVVRFNRVQTEIIHAHSDAPIAHNYMGRVTDFDHYKVGDDLDIASWDSYPLGFLENVVGAEDAHKRRYNRQGDPDFQAFHHDLYRAVGRGRWWVMEQQPGPVNWAPYNPAPLPGMVRLWSWEAFAHGAEAVCYFRWRQAPFAQEQMHAGLLRPDSADAPAMDEARQVAAEIAEAPQVQPRQVPVALVFDYEADWAWDVQPHGAGLSYFGLVLECYRALRRAGLSVDIVRPDPAHLAGYKAIFAPGLMILPDDLKAAFLASDAQVVLGPRAGARSRDMAIPAALPPDLPGFDLKVTRVESMRPDMPVALSGGGAVTGYLDEIEGAGDPVLETETGRPVALAFGGLTYLAGWLDRAGFDRLVAQTAARAGVATRPMPEGVRIRDTGTERFWFNYTAETVKTDAGDLPPAGVLRQPL